MASEMVAIFLYYHAIELYLKSFLRLHGDTPKRLRKIGHDYSVLAFPREETRATGFEMVKGFIRSGVRRLSPNCGRPVL